MKKQIQLIIFSLFLTGCANNSTQKETVASKVDTKNTGAVVATDAVPKVKHKHKRRPLPEGVISLDIIESNQTVHLLLGKHQHGKKSLWYQQSNDAGGSWTEAVKIIDQEHLEANFNRGSDAQLAVQGDNIVAIWASRKEGAGRHNSGPMSAARSSDNGRTWQVSPIPADSEVAHNFFDMDGNTSSISTVWLDRREESSVNKPAKKGLRHAQSTDGGLTWTKDKTLDDRTCACCWNTAKYSENEELFVMYRDQDPSDMSIGVLDKQQQWTKLSHVGDFKWDFKGCPHIGGGIAFQDQSQLIHTIVGTGHPEHLGVFYLRSTDNGKNWTEPVQLGDESALHSDLASNEDSRVVAVWDMRTEDGLAIFYAESNDKGLTWSDSKQVSQKGFRATHPKVVFNQSRFLVVWTESAEGITQSFQMQQL